MSYPTAGNSGPGGPGTTAGRLPWPMALGDVLPPATPPPAPVDVDPHAWDLARWAREVDTRFHTLHGDIFCPDPGHERSGLSMSRTPMGDLVAWIAEHWHCRGVDQ